LYASPAETTMRRFEEAIVLWMFFREVAASPAFCQSESQNSVTALRYGSCSALHMLPHSYTATIAGLKYLKTSTVARGYLSHAQMWKVSKKFKCPFHRNDDHHLDKCPFLAKRYTITRKPYDGPGGPPVQPALPAPTPTPPTDVAGPNHVIGAGRSTHFHAGPVPGTNRSVRFAKPIAMSHSRKIPVPMIRTPFSHPFPGSMGVLSLLRYSLCSSHFLAWEKSVL
jgi:hypothetical protein